MQIVRQAELEQHAAQVAIFNARERGGYRRNPFASYEDDIIVGTVLVRGDEGVMYRLTGICCESFAIHKPKKMARSASWPGQVKENPFGSSSGRTILRTGSSPA
ncbi:MAG: hypothetical protein ABI240_13685 [Sphingomonas sp.]